MSPLDTEIVSESLVDREGTCKNACKQCCPPIKPHSEYYHHHLMACDIRVLKGLWSQCYRRYRGSWVQRVSVHRTFRYKFKVRPFISHSKRKRNLDFFSLMHEFTLLLHCVVHLAHCAVIYDVRRMSDKSLGSHRSYQVCCCYSNFHSGAAVSHWKMRVLMCDAASRYLICMWQYIMTAAFILDFIWSWGRWQWILTHLDQQKSHQLHRNEATTWCESFFPSKAVSFGGFLEATKSKSK